MKPKFIAYLLGAILMTGNITTVNAAENQATNYTPDLSNGADNFYKSDLVKLQKVTFLNQYKMKVTGNLFTPKDLKAGEKRAAIIVGHPMGAVKEQSSNLNGRARIYHAGN